MNLLATKKVEILLATYNGELFLREQLDSLFSQTFSEFSLLIWDDGSTDGTVDIVNEYCRKFPDQVILFKGNPVGSAKSNFIRLMRQATGDYIFCCDQDDIWLPNKIESALEAMQKLEIAYGIQTPLLVHTDLKVVDKTLCEISPSFQDYIGLKPLRNLKESLMQNDVTGCTALYNKALSELFKTYPPDPNKIIMHDWWLALIAQTFGKKHYLLDQTILYRQHGNNSLGAKKSRGFRYKIEKFFSRKNVKKALYETYIQSGEFKNNFEHVLSAEVVHMLTEFSEMENMNKFERISQMIRHDFLRKQLKQKLAQIFFC